MNMRNENKRDYAKWIDIIIKCNLLGVRKPRLVLQQMLNDFPGKSANSSFNRSFFNPNSVSADEILAREISRILADSGNPNPIPAVLKYLNANYRKLTPHGRLTPLVGAFLSVYEHYRKYMLPALNNMLNCQDVWQSDVTRYVDAILLCLSSELRPNFREAALSAIMNISESMPLESMRTDIMRSLVEYMNNYPGRQICHAIIMLKRMIPDSFHADIVDNLAIQIHNPDSEICIAAIEAIGELSRIVPAESLGKIGDDLREIIINSRKKPAIRIAALRVLRTLLCALPSDAHAIMLNVLLDSICDPHPEIRLEAGMFIRQYQAQIPAESLRKKIDMLLRNLASRNINLSSHVPAVICYLSDCLDNESMAVIIETFMNFITDKTRLVQMRMEVMNALMQLYDKLPANSQKQLYGSLQILMLDESADISQLACRHISERKEWLYAYPVRFTAADIALKLRSPEVQEVIHAGRKLSFLGCLLFTDQVNDAVGALLSTLIANKNNDRFAQICDVLNLLRNVIPQKKISSIIEVLLSILSDAEVKPAVMIIVLKTMAGFYTYLDLPSAKACLEGCQSIISDVNRDLDIRVEALNCLGRLNLNSDDDHPELMRVLLECANDKSETVRLAAFTAMSNPRLRIFQDNSGLADFFASCLAMKNPVQCICEIMTYLKTVLPYDISSLYLNKLISLLNDHAKWDLMKPAEKSKCIHVLSLYAPHMNYIQKLAAMCRLRQLIASEETLHEYKILFLKIYGESRKDLIFDMLKKMPNEQNIAIPNEMVEHVMSMTL